MHIRLVKLGIVRAQMDRYPTDTTTFLHEELALPNPTCEGEGLRRRCSFPLEATLRQGFTPREFRAYRLLGRWLARHALCTPPPVFEGNDENFAGDAVAHASGRN